MKKLTMMALLACCVAAAGTAQTMAAETEADIISNETEADIISAETEAETEEEPLLAPVYEISDYLEIDDEDYKGLWKYLETHDWIDAILCDDLGDFPKWPIPHVDIRNIAVMLPRLLKRFAPWMTLSRSASAAFHERLMSGSVSARVPSRSKKQNRFRAGPTPRAVMTRTPPRRRRTPGDAGA